MTLKVKRNNNYCFCVKLIVYVKSKRIENVKQLFYKHDQRNKFNLFKHVSKVFIEKIQVSEDGHGRRQK